MVPLSWFSGSDAADHEVMVFKPNASLGVACIEEPNGIVSACIDLVEFVCDFT